jgi:hypothetical protein
MGYCSYGPKLALGFINEFNIIYLFSIYIVYYYETKLILQGYEIPKIMGIFMNLGMLCAVAYLKFRPSNCKNKSLKFKYCRDKKCNSC